MESLKLEITAQSSSNKDKFEELILKFDQLDVHEEKL